MIVRMGPRKFQLLSRSTGRVLGTHPSYAAALRQERAIKASQARAAKRNPSMPKKHPLDDPRIRFNWGYHDGASDVRNNRHKSDEWFRKHFDKVYLQGYAAGWRDMQNGEYQENSTRAWNERRRRGDKSYYWK